MKAKLSDLNLHLFEQMERLNDEELSDEELDKEIKRGRAMTAVSKEIIRNGRLVLDSQKHADEYGYGQNRKSSPLSMLTGGNYGQED